jgi:uncharacterized protein
MARIKGEGPARARASGGRAAHAGWQLEELAMFFFVAVPVAGSVLTGIFGRKLGSLLTAGAAGGAGLVADDQRADCRGAGLGHAVLVGCSASAGGAARRPRERRPPIPTSAAGGGGGFGGGGGGSGGGGGGFSLRRRRRFRRRRRLGETGDGL